MKWDILNDIELRVFDSDINLLVLIIEFIFFIRKINNNQFSASI